MRRIVVFAAALASACLPGGHDVALAQCVLPYQLTNGQTADAAQVMADLNALANCLSSAPGGTANAVQFNAGGGSFGGVGPLTNGQIVIGSTGNAPQAATLSAGPGITITNNPGGITITSTGGGGGGSLDRNSTFNAPTVAQFPNLAASRGKSLTSDLFITNGVAGLVMFDGNGGVTGNLTATRPIPGTPGAAFEFAARAFLPKGQNQNVYSGIVIGDASGAYLYFGVLGWSSTANLQLYLAHWNGSNWGDDSFSTPLGQDDWFKINLDGSGNFLLSVSRNGREWAVLNPAAGSNTYNPVLSSYIGTPTNYGFLIGHFNVNQVSPMTVPWFFSTEFPAPF